MLNNAKGLGIIEYLREFYGRFERPISSLSLVLGFVFDAVTLQRVDALWENIWVALHLLIVAVCIILINRSEVPEGAERDPKHLNFWYVNGLQFFFGGILSTYLVFYFRSGSLSVNWPFILLLVLAFWANEHLKRAYVRLDFPIVLLYISIFSFSIFLVPVVLHSMGNIVFLLSGIVSLVAMGAFLYIFDYFTHKLDKNIRSITVWIGIVFLLVNTLYFTGLIPPIPLSLKDSGAYYLVSHDKEGDYVLTAEKKTWKNFFIAYDDFYVGQNDFVFIYSSVFSPSGWKTTIVHHYQYYDQNQKTWIEKGKVELLVNGGRGNGFRTYSIKKGLTPGKWRVRVETVAGQTIGTVQFNVVAGSPRVLQTFIK
jgi:hypothetical protein